MLQLKWKMVVVWCFFTATIEWFLQGVGTIFGLDAPRKIIIFVVVFAWLITRLVNGNVDFLTLLDSIVINLLASLLLTSK